MKWNLFIFALLCLLDIANNMRGRSIHRPDDPLMPKITTRWLDSDKTYYLKDSHLEETPLFKTFDKTYFYQHMLPKSDITYRNNPSHTVSGKVLGQLAVNLLDEILRQKKKFTFTHFNVIKNRDFAAKDKSGLLIFKYKKYPFILKLFIENPQGFVRPYAKGFEPTCFFTMGSAMRHLTGFTRIKNLEAMKQIIQSNPYWAARISWPRKWFWEPDNNKWFEIVGTNIGRRKKTRIELPAVYGVICDAIDAERELSILNRSNRKLGMSLSQFLRYRIDPHLKNFLIEKGTNKIVIVDTEHFPTLVGLKKEMRAKTYSAWYLKLTGKFLSDNLFRNKKTRRNLQLFPLSPYLL